MNMQDPSGMNMMKQQFPEQEQLKCPRCESSNTKFCYYNNYNLSQPRHFCKSCRRYWTKGGSLRNIPVGGGTRKNAKRPKRHNPDPDPTRTSSPRTLSSPQASAADHEPTRLHALPGRPDPNMVDITGTFSSLLATNTHFMNPNGSAPKMADSGLNPVLEEQGNDGSESYLLQSGESVFWGGGGGGAASGGGGGGENGWPDLAIYTPGSSYQ